MDVLNEDSSEVTRQQLQEETERLKEVLKKEDFSDDDDDDDDEAEEDDFARSSPHRLKFNLQSSLPTSNCYADVTDGDTEDSGDEQEPTSSLLYNRFIRLNEQEELSQPKQDGEEEEIKPTITAAAAPDPDSSIVNEELLAQVAEGSSEDIKAYPQVCLMLNQSYKEVLSETLELVQLALAHNREKQESIKAALKIKDDTSDNLENRKRIPLTSYAVPYFKDVNGRNPPDNADVALRKACFPDLVLPASGWIIKDTEKLQAAVKKDALQLKLRPCVNRMEIECEKLDSIIEEEEKEMVKSRIQELKMEMARVKNLDYKSLVGTREESSQFDWMKISVQEFDAKHSPMSCQLMWQNVVHPQINRSRWKEEEDEKLIELVEKHGLNDWKTVSEEMKTDRSAFLCIHRFQTKINPTTRKGFWNKMEDETLKELVEHFRVGEYIPWGTVSEAMEGRSREQCIARYQRLAENKEKVGRWSIDEDLKLISAIKVYGKDWKHVAQCVPGRTSVQCRGRYTDCLSPDIKFGHWTYYEDRSIVLHALENGPCQWSELAKKLPGRTDNQVSQRFRRICNYQDAQDYLDTIPENVRTRIADKKQLISVADSDTLLDQMQAEEVIQKSLEVKDKMSELNMANLSTLIEKDRSVNTTIAYKEGLKKLYEFKVKQAIKTDLERRKKDAELRAADRKNGLIIPDVPQGRSAGVKELARMVLQRKQLHRAVQNQLERNLRKQNITPAQGLMSALSHWVETGECSGELTLPMVEALNSVTMRDTVKKLETIAKNLQESVIRKQLGNKKFKRNVGRPAKDEEDTQLDKQIAAILRRSHYFKVKQRRGRPRKVTAEAMNVIQSKNIIGDKVLDEGISNKMAQLLMISMNTDFMGALENCHIMEEKIQEKEMKNREHMSSSAKLKKHLAKPGVTWRIRSPSVDSNITKDNCDNGEEDSDPESSSETTTKKFGRTPIWKKNQRLRLKALGGELKSEVELVALDHEIARENMRLLANSVPQEHITEFKKQQEEARVASDKGVEYKPCNNVYQNGRLVKPPSQFGRRGFIGKQAEQAYRMPPLPPNCATVTGFKELLLRRKELMSLGGHMLPPQEKNSEEDQPETDPGDETSKRKEIDKQLCRLPSRLSVRELKELRETLMTGTSKHQIMVSRLLNNTEKLLERTMAEEESGTDSNFNNKNYERLGRIKKSHDYKVLKARFNAMFLWPALLSNIPTCLSPAFDETQGSNAEMTMTSKSADHDEGKDSAKNFEGFKLHPDIRKKKNRYPCTAAKQARINIRKRQLESLNRFRKNVDGEEPEEPPNKKPCTTQNMDGTNEHSAVQGHLNGLVIPGPSTDQTLPTNLSQKKGRKKKVFPQGNERRSARLSGKIIG